MSRLLEGCRDARAHDPRPFAELLRKPRRLGLVLSLAFEGTCSSSWCERNARRFLCTERWALRFQFSPRVLASQVGPSQYDAAGVLDAIRGLVWCFVGLRDVLFCQQCCLAECGYSLCGSVLCSLFSPDLQLYKHTVPATIVMIIAY